MTNFKTEIVARLMNGESAEVLAEELSVALNSAVNEAKAAKEAEAKAKAAKEAEAKKIKNELAAELLDALDAYLNFAFPDLSDLTEDVEVEDVHELFEGVIAAAELMSAIGAIGMIKPMFDTEKPVHIEKPVSEASDALWDFLRDNGLAS